MMLDNYPQLDRQRSQQRERPQQHFQLQLEIMGQILLEMTTMVLSYSAVVLGSSNSGLNCRRKDEPHIEQMPQPKKPRLVFTDLQRRTLQAIFKETKRPSKEMQVTIARQLGLEPTTVGNFFMNARRRSMDKWRDDDTKIIHHPNSCQNQQQEQEHDHDNDQEEMEIERDRDSQSEGTNAAHGQYSSPERYQTSGISPLGHFDDDGEMDLELEHHDFLMDDNERDDML
ncbi:homeobox protein onecut isoform X4 [Drosophila busckii]|uniref:homeobox protein onecut isoform X4 n=1 Tax=Drosophila busckii TaxID=30019 RepID=UPI00083F1210|nr:homeobox protein onecut isoform X4 [Drosophila busckii]